MGLHDGSAEVGLPDPVPACDKEQYFFIHCRRAVPDLDYVEGSPRPRTGGTRGTSPPKPLVPVVGRPLLSVRFPCIDGTSRKRDILLKSTFV